MINEGVAFMNSALEAAATSMGVHYIDIQDVLDGGRLCEGSEYVTGLSDLGPIKIIDSDTQEAFHPNAKAHINIAQRIIAQGFQVESGRNSEVLSELVEPTLPSYFAGTERRQTMQYDVTTDSVVEGDTMPIYIQDGSLAPGSNATLTIFSDAIDLGSVSVNSVGGIEDTLALPSSLKPGRHVLTIDGLSPSGEPVEYFQFLTVTSSILGDEDGDGIADVDDRCPFVTSWVDETSQQDICVNSVPSDTDATPSDNQTEDASPQPSTKADSDMLTSTGDDASHVVAVTEDDSLQKSNGDTSEPTREVLGIHQERPQVLNGNDYHNNWFIVGTIGLLSTLAAGYGIVRYARRRL